MDFEQDFVEDQAVDPVADPAVSEEEVPAHGADPDELSDNLSLDEEVTDEYQLFQLMPYSAEETIWTKRFEDYTPTEGYLMLLFILAVSFLMLKLFRKGW